MTDRTSGESEIGSDKPDDAGVVKLRQLVSDHYQSLYRYAYRLSGREADAEDLTQQTYLLAQRKLHQLREPDKADRWLYAILRSCFLKGISRTRHVEIESMELIVEDRAELGRIDQALDREELQFALDHLPPDYRIIVLMFYFEDLSYKEIAEQLEIPIGTVMSRLARGKTRLRELLQSDSRPTRTTPSVRTRVPAP